MFDFFSQKFSSLFSGLSDSKTLTESAIQETLSAVESGLLEAHVPYAVVQQFIESVKHRVFGQKVIGKLNPAEQLMKVVQDKIIDFLGGRISRLPLRFLQQ